MHVEARLFEFLTAFFFVAAIVYVILSHEPRAARRCSSPAAFR